MKTTTPIENIQYAIITIRDQKVMLDRELAKLYGIETRRLNEQVKRNAKRFPPDFMFQLTQDEKEWIIENIENQKTLRFSKTCPNVFTEHGAVMLAAILNTDQAIQASILVVRAFVEFRKLISIQKALIGKIEALEKRYDAQFSIVFKTIKRLIDQSIVKPKPIGFNK